MQLYYINPGTPPKKKRKRAKSKLKKGVSSMAAKGRRAKPGRKKKSRSTARYKKNPGSPKVKYVTRYKANPKKRKRTRYRKNPSDGGIDPMKGNNILQLAGGTALGAVGIPILGNMLGFEGPAKYVVKGGASIAGYYIGKSMGMPKLGLAFMIAGLAVTAYEAAQDYGVISGIENTLLGYSSYDVAGMQSFANGVNGNVGMVAYNDNLNGMVAYNQGLDGMVAYNQPPMVNDYAMAGHDKDIY